MVIILAITLISCKNHNPSVDYVSMNWFFGYASGVANDSTQWEQLNVLIESTIANPNWVGGDADMEGLQFQIDSITGGPKEWW